MKKKKRVLNKKKLFLFLAIIFAIVFVILIGSMIIKNLNEEVPNDIKEEEPKEDILTKYEYEIDLNGTDYYKDLFDDLKETLESEEVNELVYAEIVSKLFIADYFNLDNKFTNSDIGGVQFVYSSFREDFINISKEGIYYHVESNIYNERSQELPIVENVEIVSTENTKYKYGEATDELAYKINLKVTYKKDLGYQQNVTVYLVHNETKLEIVELKS